jgi:hypothetical protein
MFWNRKKKLPITEGDKIWVDEYLNWLRNEFGNEHFLGIKTITPTKTFYDRTFDGTEEDAEFILKRTMELMKIKDVDIKLKFFSDGFVNGDDGSILTTPGDINGKWNGAAGTYQKIDNEVIISLETRQLKEPISLIATISHELSHQILLGEGRIEENDEYLTDLTAIMYGFGIFIGNSKFNFSQFSTNNGFGWQSSNQGYLPEQIIAYSMAWLSNERKESIDYTKYLKPTLKKYLTQSFECMIKE